MQDTTREYRKTVRRLLRENGLRNTFTATDYPGGTCNSHSGRYGDRIVTHKPIGPAEQLEEFTEELTLLTRIYTGKRPRWTGSGYLKFNTKISQGVYNTMKEPDKAYTVPIQNSYSTRVGTLKDRILAGPLHSDNTEEQGSEEKKK